MIIERPQVGPTLKYRGKAIGVFHLGPDLICRVDGVELSAFYLNAEAARNGGKRYVDQIEDERTKK